MTQEPRVVGGSRFKCPHCAAYAQQHWANVAISGHSPNATLKMSVCLACKGPSLWIDDVFVWPDDTDVPPPNVDLTDDIVTDYKEAMTIVNKSPRGASALLRLSIQKLCVELGLPGENLNTDIGKLVKRGLPPAVQQALDSVRVVGNEAVHPGTMDIKDDVETASALFSLVNAVANSLISIPKQAASIYESLPQTKRDAIEERDSNG